MFRPPLRTMRVAQLRLVRRLRMRTVNSTVSISKRFREARERAGLSHDDAASGMGISGHVRMDRPRRLSTQLQVAFQGSGVTLFRCDVDAHFSSTSVAVILGD